MRSSIDQKLPIPHEEKVFSIFERTPAGLVELFGLYRRGRSFACRPMRRFRCCRRPSPCFLACSFDRGFHSPSNRCGWTRCDAGEGHAHRKRGSARRPRVRCGAAAIRQWNPPSTTWNAAAWTGFARTAGMASLERSLSQSLLQICTGLAWRCEPSGTMVSGAKASAAPPDSTPSAAPALAGPLPRGRSPASSKFVRNRPPTVHSRRKVWAGNVARSKPEDTI